MRTTLSILCLLLAANIAAYSLWEADGLGNFSLSPDARTAAMGDAGTAGGQGLFSLLLNPANLGAQPAGLHVQLGGALLMDADKRSIPLFDSFDSVVDEATYADNTNTWSEFSLAAAWGRSFGLHTVQLGLHHAPVVNFDARYEEEVRTDDNSDYNSYPPLIAWNEIDSEGAITATGGTLSLQSRSLLDWFSVGVSVEMLSGERTWERRVVWTEAARDSVQTFILPDQARKTDTEWDGMRFRGGLQCQLNDRVALALAYTAKAELDQTLKTRTLVQPLYSEGYGNVVETDGEYILPGSVRLGVHYQPRNFWRTHVNFDVELVQWSGVDAGFDDAWRWYVGIEHSVWQTTPLRLGFRWETSPVDDSVAMPTITGGAGFPLMAGVNVDVALHYTQRSYHATDLFPDGYYNDVTHNTADPAYESRLWNYTVPADRDELDRVDESLLGLQVSLSYHF
ncbi:MAG: hypothetical protein K8R90_00460 [Candidatus Cloacimonetes bacterium]|nr:hypothetical protein [Candidatus Cloacimonadota bacterium]